MAKFVSFKQKDIGGPGWFIYINPDNVECVGPVVIKDEIDPNLAHIVTKSTEYVVQHTQEEVVRRLTP